MEDLNKKISDLERELDILRKTQKHQKDADREAKKNEQEERIKALTTYVKSYYGDRLVINSVGYLEVCGKLDGKFVTIYELYDDSTSPEEKYCIKYERSNLCCFGPYLSEIRLPRFNPLNKIQIGDTFVISATETAPKRPRGEHIISSVKSLEYFCKMSFGDNGDACYGVTLYNEAISIEYEILINRSYRLPLYNRDLDQSLVILESYNYSDETEKDFFLFGSKAETFINEADMPL